MATEKAVVDSLIQACLPNLRQQLDKLCNFLDEQEGGFDHQIELISSQKRWDGERYGGDPAGLEKRKGDLFNGGFQELVFWNLCYHLNLPAPHVQIHQEEEANALLAVLAFVFKQAMAEDERFDSLIHAFVEATKKVAPKEGAFMKKCLID